MKEMEKMDRKNEEATDFDSRIYTCISICEKGFYSNDFSVSPIMKNIFSDDGGRLN